MGVSSLCLAWWGSPGGEHVLDLSLLSCTDHSGAVYTRVTDGKSRVSVLEDHFLVMFQCASPRPALRVPILRTAISGSCETFFHGGPVCERAAWSSLFLSLSLAHVEPHAIKSSSISLQASADTLLTNFGTHVGCFFYPRGQNRTQLPGLGICPAHLLTAHRDALPSAPSSWVLATASAVASYNHLDCHPPLA